MARKIQTRWVDSKISQLLNSLIDEHTATAAYAQTMYQLGVSFGKIFLDKFSFSNKKIAVACTVEDADYLAKGILDVLEEQASVALAVFWNKRFKPNKDSEISVAPIIREYHDSNFKGAEILIVVKSVISSACVVRTNLTKLIEEQTPDQIFIVAPVILEGAQTKLEAAFDSDVSKKFQYLYFAEDSERKNDGTVVPGIGGDVYQRLGFSTQVDKNRFVPEIVKQRRHEFA